MINRIGVINSSANACKSSNNINNRQIFLEKTNADTLSINNKQQKSNLSFKSEHAVKKVAIFSLVTTGITMLGITSAAMNKNISDLAFIAGGFGTIFTGVLVTAIFAVFTRKHN